MVVNNNYSSMQMTSIKPIESIESVKQVSSDENVEIADEKVGEALKELSYSLEGDIINISGIIENSLVLFV